MAEQHHDDSITGSSPRRRQKSSHTNYFFKKRMQQSSGAKSSFLVSSMVLLGSIYVVMTLFAVAAIGKYRKPSSSILNSAETFSRRRSLRSIDHSAAIRSSSVRKLQWSQQSFPIHTSTSETEAIPHPGIAFSGAERIKVLMPDLDFPDTLTVPTFWNPEIENGQGGVREFLGYYGEKLITAEEADQIGSWKDEKETIFVSIASYRDSECQPTLESLYARAKYPERIRVAVVDQIEDGDVKCGEPKVPCDQDPDQPLCKYRHLIDVYEVKSYLMVGPVLARHVAHRMYRGEYFVLQVDAHVRFTEGWDEDIIAQWYSTGNEMAVLSTYLTDIANSIDPTTHKSLREERNMMCNIKYDGSGKNSRFVLKSPLNGIPAVKGSPMIHPFWSAGFSFSRGHFVVQVPYDQHLPMLFQGEESSIVIRGFTYGYDFYAPERSVAFHIYAIKENISRRNRPKFWENETLYSGALEKSTARLNGITGLSGSAKKEYYRVDEKKYGLGKVRDKETYFQTFGIHPNTQSVDGFLCGVVKETMHKEFSKHLRQDGMGIDYKLVDFKMPKL
jgi:[Skp1-protein]-hydroxyproline N-acetylglucosaminyltransferase